MQPGTRKLFTNERSIPKQSKPSYQYAFHTEKDSTTPYYPQYGGRRELLKTSSDADLKVPKEQYFRNLNQRRKNEGHMGNLKSELQNLKNQVNKLMGKELALRTPQQQRLHSRQQRSEKKVNFVTKGFHEQMTDRDQDFSDTASMMSVTTQKVLNEPLRRLQKKAGLQNYDQGYYMQLQNDVLKTEIKNLKNKYVSKKRQLTEKCELLDKKVEYLEVSLQKSQEALAQCRKALEMEVMAIKRQITLKTEIKHDVHLPESDKPSNGDGNQMLQEKLKGLYEEMSQKNRLLNNMSIELGDVENMLERKKFQVKKQSQLSHELSKQLELSKRESSRLQLLLQTQINKKKDLSRQNSGLKQKNKQLVQDIYKKEQIVTGSEQYQNRMAEELQVYKRKEEQQQTKLSLLRDENKKLKQLVATNNDEISSLKKSSDETILRVAQLSRRLKDQQEKYIQREEYYRRLLQETILKHQEKINILTQHYEHQSTLNSTKEHWNTNEQSKDIDELLKEKERQVNRWKAEYKILKLKHQQKHTSETIKNNENQHYYKSYIDFKSKVELLQQKNTLLKQSAQNYLSKLSQKETQAIKLQLQQNQKIQHFNQQVFMLQHQVQTLQDQLTLAKNQFAEATTKNEEETKYRQELQNKIQHFVSKTLIGHSSDQQDHHIPKELQQDQNQESSPQKNTKFLLQDDDQRYHSPKHQGKATRRNAKCKTEKYIFQLSSQSQRLQLEQLSQSITIIKKRVMQQDQKLTKNVKQLKNKDTQINKLKKQIRELLESHEKQLIEIRGKYAEERAQMLIKSAMQTEKEVKELCRKEVELHKEKLAEILAQNVQMKRNISQIQNELLNLRQEAKSLSHLYNVKCSDVEEILQKNHNQLTLKQKKIDQLQVLKNQRQTNLMNEISNLKDEISSLRIEIKHLTSINQKIEFASFDEALRNQIQTSNTLREELSKKNEEVFRVRDNYTLLRSQYDNLRSEAEIEKLKNLSQRKNLEVQYQIQQQNLKNKLNQEEKKVSSLQQKISLVIEENKKKDSFIQSYIMGKKLPQGDKEFIAQFIKQYGIKLNGKSINQKLKADSHELDKMAAYNYRLLKDMADLKERMLLYETIEEDVLSFYDSKQSGELNRQNDIDSPNASLCQSLKSPHILFKKMSSLVDVEKSI